MPLGVSSRLGFVSAGMAAATLSLATVQADDLGRGRALFEACRACHALDPNAPPMAGPKLAGLIGRRVAGDPTFDYSPVLRQAGAAERRWDRAMLDTFLADPEAMFPGMWMTSRRMTDASDRRALADFIADPASR
jgi:cytochrome c